MASDLTSGVRGLCDPEVRVTICSVQLVYGTKLPDPVGKQGLRPRDPLCSPTLPYPCVCLEGEPFSNSHT